MLDAHLLALLVTAAAAFERIPQPPSDGGIRLDSHEAVELDDGGYGADGGTGVDAGPPPDAGTRPSVPMRFRNNRVMAEEVYRSILNLPSDANVNRATAFAIRTQLEDFLHRCGYVLATVSTAVNTDASGPIIDIDINEGLLEKVVFRGKFTFKTLRFKLALQLPDDVFNRPELERQIRALTKELELGRVWYELVPTREVKHIAPQVESLGPMNEIQGYELIHPREPYELHIFFEEKNWDVGSWLDLRTGPIDGLEVIGVRQGQGLLSDDDRYRLSISGGAGLRNPIDATSAPQLLLVPELYPTFSRAYAEAIYYAAVPYVRPTLEARSELVSRQRKDLNIENYFNLNTDALVNADYEFSRRQTLTFGLGERYQEVFDIQAPQNSDGTYEPVDAPASVTDLNKKGVFRSFAELRIDLLFADGNDRWDRRNELTVEARQFLSGQTKEFGEARVAWQRVFAYGWDNLWIKASGAYLYGEVPFTYQEPLNSHLRNVFGNTYVDRIASETTEFRFSITRDIFKFSLFNDVATFGWFNPDPASNFKEEFGVGDAFGPGFHALVQGMFQIDMYYALGISNRPLQEGIQLIPAPGTPVGKPSASLSNYISNGFSLNLQKVF